MKENPGHKDGVVFVHIYISTYVISKKKSRNFRAVKKNVQDADKHCIL